MLRIIVTFMLALMAQHAFAQSAVGVFGASGAELNGVLANGGSSSSTNQTSPVNMLLGTNVSFIQMSAGFDHACGLDQDGGVWCWGSNALNQVGSGALNPQTTPLQVSLPLPATFIHAGYQATCAILNDGTARCWGDNTTGKLGNPAFTAATYASSAAVEPGTSATSFLTGVVDIDVTQQHGCASASMGGSVHQIYCWGSNVAGQVGNGVSTQGSPSPQPTPTAVKTGTCATNAYTSSGAATTTSQITSTMDFLHVSVGRGNTAARGSTCGVNSAGSLFCWGENNNGESGMVASGTAAQISCPSAVNTSMFTATIADVDHGSGSTSGGPCARATDGTAYCWGNNNTGRLGNGTSGNTNSSYTPVKVLTAAATPLTNVIDLSVGSDHNCALRYDGTLYCWGANANGEWGNGNTTSSDYAILSLQGPTPSTSIFNGAAVTVMATGDGYLLAGAPLGGPGQVVNPTAVSWQMFALPCNPIGTQEVTSALGGNFPAACYKLNSGTNGGVNCSGKGWVVDFYKISNTSTPGTYDYVNAGDKLNYNNQGNTPLGGGYWIKSYQQPNAGRMSVKCSNAGGSKPKGTFANTTYCPSGNCFVYPLSNPRAVGVGNNAWNLAPNPLPYPVDWSSVRVCAGYNASAGTCTAAYTPCQAANSTDASCTGTKANPVLLADNAISIFNPKAGAYHTFNDLQPATVSANLGYFQSFFVNVGDGVIGRSDVVLLIPAASSSRPPFVGPGAVTVNPGAPSSSATTRRVSPAAAGKTAREWSAVLEVYDDARRLSEQTASVGTVIASGLRRQGRGVFSQARLRHVELSLRHHSAP
ncbi:MAG: RCC1 domain-containing protein [Methylocystis sp.]|uniref:RCC1 domain-containing protein n=1 Tax=Methylocystis sp. TaxID=1911079 RepID=UPI003DA23BA8